MMINKLYVCPKSEQMWEGVFCLADGGSNAFLGGGGQLCFTYLIRFSGFFFRGKIRNHSTCRPAHEMYYMRNSFKSKMEIKCSNSCTLLDVSVRVPDNTLFLALHLMQNKVHIFIDIFEIMIHVLQPRHHLKIQVSS